MGSSRKTHKFFTPSPWRSGNQFSLLPNGDQFFPEIISAIESAHSSIDLEMYLVESGNVATRFVDALCRAANRKLRVRVLFDHVGSRGFNQQDQLRLKESGVYLRFYNRLRRKKLFRNLARDHRKIIIIDDQLAFVGGTGITDKFDPTTSNQDAWRELMIRIQGPVVRDWKGMFEHIWWHYKSPFNFKNWRNKLQQTKYSSFDNVKLESITPHARINGSRGFGIDPIKGALISQLRKAKRRAWISTAYFYPSRKLRREIKHAALRGVDVRLLLPGPKTDHPSIRYAGQSYYRKLLKCGVQIYEYQPHFLHMKVALIDNWSSIGSCNFDRWNLRWNLEANQEIIDAAFAEDVSNMLLDDFSHCKIIESKHWASRSWFQRFREFFWSRVGLLITKIFDQ
ncbi:MAG: cardiolipin synthase B [Moraxellaceae bacterium]|nr:MAG: cardiolipin synthase B [Moraxellaceae bacterium]